MKVAIAVILQLLVGNENLVWEDTRLCNRHFVNDGAA